MRQLIDRFIDKTRKAGPCLEWTGAINRSGYGTIWNAGADLAHRVAWELAHGPIPQGMHVLHKCDNRKCVRPGHLFLGTNAENVADRDRKRRGKLPDNSGTKNGQAKLTAAIVKEIRERYGAGNKSQREVAESFGLSQQAVSYAINGWKSVT